MPKLRTLLGVGFGFAAAALLARSGLAQDWPIRPVTLVVPFAAGGPVDTTARIMAARLSQSLGQQFIVENASGAGGMIGGNRVAKAAPDGYTVLYGNRSTHIYSQILSKKPLYDALTEFAPVTAFVENSACWSRAGTFLPARSADSRRNCAAGMTSCNLPPPAPALPPTSSAFC